VGERVGEEEGVGEREEEALRERCISQRNLQES
jgi:hypothetical protein